MTLLMRRKTVTVVRFERAGFALTVEVMCARLTLGRRGPAPRLISSATDTT